MQPRKLVYLCSLALLVAAMGPAAAAAKDKTAPLYAKLKQRFTTHKPGASTGWEFDGALKPFPAGEQVPPQRSATWVFPRGTRIDLRGVTNCDASEEQLASDGLAACPANSLLSSGEGSLFAGAAGIVDVEVHVLAARPDLVALFATESGAVLRVLRVTIDRNRATAILPRVELGSYEAAVTSVHLKLDRAGTRKHPLVRTPKKCPRKGKWKFRYLPHYDEPHGVQRSTNKVRCRRGR
jgi:hypothetical protein